MSSDLQIVASIKREISLHSWGKDRTAHRQTFEVQQPSAEQMTVREIQFIFPWESKFESLGPYQLARRSNERTIPPS
jgi:hypothetical protein